MTETMDEAPPSYSEAISRDPWTLISACVDPRDLYAACLVSRAWNGLFTRLLWEQPIFAREDGSMYRECRVIYTWTTHVNP